MERLTVVMPVRGEEEMTRLTLDSLRRHCGDGVDRIVIVDNGDDDETGRMLDEMSWRVVERIEGAPELNFSQACNRGAALAGDGTLLFLNNDVESRVDWLTTLTALHHETKAIVSATLTYPDGRLQHAGEALPLWGNPFILGDGGRLEDPRYQGVKRRWGAIAALMLIDKALFDDVGGFDEGYRFGLEDVDLCLKGGEQGIPTLVQGMGGIVHHTSQTVGKQTSAERAEQVASNNRRFADRWDALIAERQGAYCEVLRRRGIERIVIAGAGSAAATAGGVLVRHGFDVVAYLDDTGATLPDDAPKAPVVGYDDAASLKGEVILPASGALAAIEGKLAKAGLASMIIDPEPPLG